MSMRMESLELIDRLCGCFETQLASTGEEAAAEMMRVIRAVADNNRCVLLADGPVAPVLKASFGNDQELWKHVELQQPDGP